MAEQVLPLHLTLLRALLPLMIKDLTRRHQKNIIGNMKTKILHVSTYEIVYYLHFGHSI